MVGLDTLVGLTTGLRCSLKRSFSRFFRVSCILFVTAFALNHVNKVFRVAGNVVSNGSCLVFGVECLRSKFVRYVSARSTILAL